MTYDQLKGETPEVDFDEIKDQWAEANVDYEELADRLFPTGRTAQKLEIFCAESETAKNIYEDKVKNAIV